MDKDQLRQVLEIYSETDSGGGRKFKVDAVFTGVLEVNLDPENDGVLIYGSSDGGVTQTVIKTDAGGAIQVDLEVASVTVTSSALPTGAATEATLLDIEAGIPEALGQTTMAASMPVVIASNQTSLPATLGASESHIGEVGIKSVIVSSTVVMSVAGAYATGDYMGTTTTPQSFSGAVRTSNGTGKVTSITISDKITTTNVAMELWLFSATFVAPTDNAAWTITDAENLTFLGFIPLPVSGWVASGANQAYNDNTLNLPIQPAATSLFYALVARGTTPAFASSDLTISLGIDQN